MSRLRLGAVALSAVAGLALAGCTTAVDGRGRLEPAVAAASPLGADGADASDAIDTVRTAMLGLEHGFEVQSAPESGSDDNHLTARYQDTDAHVDLTLYGQSAEIVGVGAKGWIRAGAAFWAKVPAVTSTAAATIADHWVRIDGPIAKFVYLIGGDTVLDTLLGTGDYAGDDDAELGAVTVRDGRRVQQLTTSQGTPAVVSLTAPRLLVTAGDDDATTFSYPDDDLDVDIPTGAIDYPA